MKRTSQKDAIMRRLEYYLNKGWKDKMKIYQKVADELGVPKPTVRRVARDLRQIYAHKIMVLQSDFTAIGINLR